MPHGDCDFEAFAQEEAYAVIGDAGFVGSPLAFIEDDHVIWSHIPNSLACRNRWRGKIVNRTRT